MSHGMRKTEAMRWTEWCKPKGNYVKKKRFAGSKSNVKPQKLMKIKQKIHIFYDK